MKYIPKFTVRNNRVKVFDQVEKDENSIDNSLRFVILAARLGGIMPLSDIKTDIPKFNWKSFYSAYSCLRFLGATLLVILQMYQVATTGVNLAKLRLLFFFSSGMVTSINFFVLSMKWPKLLEKINSVDKEISGNNERSKLKWTVKIMFFAYLSIAISEYL